MLLFILVPQSWDYLGGVSVSVCVCMCAVQKKLSKERQLLQTLDMTDCFQEDILVQKDRQTN